MKIVVVGCGKIGSALIKDFTTEGHDVIAIDSSARVIEEISNIYDIMTVCGNGADNTVLDEAGAGKANLLVACTDSDEMNMLSCFIAGRLGAEHTIARIRNPEYNDDGLGFLKKHLSLSMAINPERLAAKELFNVLKLPSAVNIETFSGRNFEIVELILKEGSALDGVKLIDLNKKTAAQFLVCVVGRGDEVYIPDGNFTLKSGDHIALTAAPTQIQKLLKDLGISQSRARNIMILGASRTAYYLAKMLIKSGNKVKIIEQNKEKCEIFAAELPGVTMICGDGASRELLSEEGISAMDAFVSLTGMDEQNILISYFASSQNVPKVITKVNRASLVGMAEKFGLETIISTRKVVSNVISRYARALQNSMGSKMETLYRLMDGKAEALEFDVAADFSHLNIPLKDMKLKKNTLIAGIIRGQKTIIPQGDDMILAGDRVIVAVAGHRITELMDILR